MPNTNVHKMKIHETININDMNITRVCGGWIYSREYRHGYSAGNTYTSPLYMRETVFIPYSDEFEKI